MKMRLVGGELFHADGQTKEGYPTFRNFTNAPKKKLQKHSSNKTVAHRDGSLYSKAIIKFYMFQIVVVSRDCIL